MRMWWDTKKWSISIFIESIFYAFQIWSAMWWHPGERTKNYNEKKNYIQIICFSSNFNYCATKSCNNFRCNMIKWCFKNSLFLSSLLLTTSHYLSLTLLEIEHTSQLYDIFSKSLYCFFYFVYFFHQLFLSHSAIVVEKRL